MRDLPRTGERRARWEQLARLAAGVLAQLLERAPHAPRNYILDQPKCAPARAAAMRTDLSLADAAKSSVQTEVRTGNTSLPPKTSQVGQAACSWREQRPWPASALGCT